MIFREDHFKPDNHIVYKKVTNLESIPRLFDEDSLNRGNEFVGSTTQFLFYLQKGSSKNPIHTDYLVHNIYLLKLGIGPDGFPKCFLKRWIFS